MKRDAKADLEMCERATKGPWAWEPSSDQANDFVVGVAVDRDGKQISGEIPPDEYDYEAGEIVELVIECREIGFNESGEANFSDAQFIAESREALPYWIKRAREAEELLKEILPFAKFSSCEYNTDPDAKPIMHCCEWSETVKQIIEFLGAEPCDK